MRASEYLILTIAFIGVIFTFISAVGVLRLPDIYARMHSAGKASTLGVSLLLLAAGLHFGGGELVRMLILILLFYATAPIATTAMARAAYRTDPDKRFTLHYDDLLEAQQRQSRRRR